MHFFARHSDWLGHLSSVDRICATIIASNIFQRSNVQFYLNGRNTPNFADAFNSLQI